MLYIFGVTLTFIYLFFLQNELLDFDEFCKILWRNEIFSFFKARYFSQKLSQQFSDVLLNRHRHSFTHVILSLF